MDKQGTRPGRERQNGSGHATTPAGGESGGRPHGPTRGGEEPDRVSTVANDP
jgi:hypothetical protein